MVMESGFAVDEQPSRERATPARRTRAPAENGRSTAGDVVLERLEQRGA
jgi:hypothetical protein